MTQITGSGAPSFQIGPRSAANYAQFANTSTPGWADALAKIGGAFAERHNRERMKEAKLAQEAEQAVKRAGWSKQIGEGSTVRELAMRDPSIINDTAFLGFLSKNRPEAAPETFEIADDPYGRGGIGQRSSTTDKIIGYQGPLAPEGPAPETFEDVQDPTDEAASGSGLPRPARSSAIRELRPRRPPATVGRRRTCTAACAISTTARPLSARTFLVMPRKRRRRR